MPKPIPGTDLELDWSNASTPKLVNPMNGGTERATITDVLLIELLEEMQGIRHQLELMHKGRNVDDNKTNKLLEEMLEQFSSGNSKTSSRSKRSSKSEDE